MKIMESLLIARDKPVYNKAGSSLPLGLFWCNISVYHVMFYHIIWFLSVPLWVCNVFSFQYYVANFSSSSTAECMNIYCHFRRDHENSDFGKLVVNKWICRKNCDYFLGRIQFEACKNASFQKNFCPKLATDLVKKMPNAHNKFNRGTITDYYTGISNNKRNQFQFFCISKNVVKKLLPCSNINKPSGMDQILAKFLKEVETALTSIVYNYKCIGRTIRISRRL